MGSEMCIRDSHSGGFVRLDPRPEHSVASPESHRLRRFGTKRARDGSCAPSSPPAPARERLYKALSEDGNPIFATVMRSTRALGMKLPVTVWRWWRRLTPESRQIVGNGDMVGDSRRERGRSKESTDYQLISYYLVQTDFI